jgi:GDP-L-fucose synthase
MKVYVAGHRGLVGSALVRVLTQNPAYRVVVRDHAQLDLLDQVQVNRFFEKEKPDWVFLAAAKVGGIYANNTYPVEFLVDNLKIQNHVIEAAAQFNVAKLLFLGSSCIYPKLCPQPIKESYLLSSELEKTNEAYSIAKIAGLKLCDAYNREYGKNFISVMPTNLYGPNDNYHLENAHALPMLLRRFHEAKITNKPVVEVWGTGKPMREFLYVDDFADACLFLMQNYDVKDIGEFVNIGTGVDCTILTLAQLIKEVVGFNGELVFDATKPDGTPRKLLDVSKINSLGWHFKTNLREGLKAAYQDFLENQSLRK